MNLTKLSILSILLILSIFLSVTAISGADVSDNLMADTEDSVYTVSNSYESSNSYEVSNLVGNFSENDDVLSDVGDDSGNGILSVNVGDEYAAGDDSDLIAADNGESGSLGASLEDNSKSYVVMESNYSSYFDSKGNLKTSVVGENSVLYLSGTFTNKTFVFSVPLTIVGDGAYLYDCSIRCVDLNSSLEGYHAKIANLNINNTYYSTYPCILVNNSDYVYVFNNTLYNTGTSSYGVYVYYSKYCNVSSNKVQTRIGQGGAWQHAGICFTGSDNNYISSNYVVVEDSNAIYLSAYNGDVSNNNVIFNNTVCSSLSNSSTSADGKSTQPSAWCYLIHVMGTNNDILNNTAFNGYRGISSEGSYNNVIGNRIYNICGSYYEGSTSSDGGDAAIFGEDYNVIANNTITNCSIAKRTDAGAIYAGSNCQIYSNYIEVVNNGKSVLTSDNCEISNNRIKAVNEGINVTGDNCKVEFNSINITEGVGIRVYSSNNLIANNTIYENTKSENTENATIKVIASKLIDGNQIINNTLISIGSSIVIIQGNVSNTLIELNNVVSNNSNWVLELQYTRFNQVTPVNTIIGDNNLNIPIIELNITDDTYSNYFKDNGELIGTVDIDSKTVIVIVNVSNKNFVFDKKVTVDGKSNGTITNGTITLKSSSSGSIIRNILFNYTYDGHNDLNIISIEAGISNLIITKNRIFLNYLNEYENYATGIIFEGNPDYLSSNIKITNNLINITGSAYNPYGIDFYNSNGEDGIISNNTQISQNNISVSGKYSLKAINLENIANSSISENNLIAIGNSDDSNSKLSSSGSDSSLSSDVFDSKLSSSGSDSSLSSDDSNSQTSYGLAIVNSNNSNITYNTVKSYAPMSFGLTVFDSENILVDSNDLDINGTGAVGVAVGTSSKSDTLNANITNNNIDILGGNYADVESSDYDFDSNYASILAVGGSVSNINNNTINTTLKNSINSTFADKLTDVSSNSYIITDDNVLNYFTNCSNGRLRDDSGVKSGDTLLFNILNDDSENRFVIDIPLNIQSYNSNGNYSSLKNGRFILNKGASGSNITNLYIDNNDGISGLIINQSSNVKIKDSSISIVSADGEEEFLIGLNIIGGENNMIDNNNISISSSSESNVYYYGIYMSNYDISTTHEALDVSVYSSSPKNTTLSNNRITIDSPYFASGISVYESIDTLVDSNKIYLTGPIIYGIYNYGIVNIYGSQNNTIISNNLVWANGSRVTLIKSDKSYNSTISTNDLTAYGDACYGYAAYSVINDNFTSNIIRVYGNNISDAEDYYDSIPKGQSGVIYFGNSTNFNVIENYIISNYTSGGDYGVIIETESSATGEISNNFIISDNSNKKGDNSVNSNIPNVSVYSNSPTNTIKNKTKTYFDFSNMTTYAVLNNARTGSFFNITLKDINGIPLSNKTIYIGFNGKVYKRVTNESGGASLQINIGYQSANTFSLSFLGDDDYDGTVDCAIIVVKTLTTKLSSSKATYKSSAKTKKLTATLKLSNNTAISGKKITFKVNGQYYIATTNSKGVATVTVSLSTKKTYTYTATFEGDNQYSSKTASNKIVIK